MTELDIWSENYSNNSTIDIFVKSRSEEENVKLALNILDYYLTPGESSSACYTLIENVEELLVQSKMEMQIFESLADTNFFKNYQNYDNIVHKLESWSKEYPYKAHLIKSIGKSYEGRDIPVLQLTNKNFTQNIKKKSIFFISGQHAREWIGPATVLYLIQKFLTEKDNKNNFLNYYDIFFIPTMNPDGYIYTATKARLWRKNRRKNENSNSFGVDLNRNWDDHWGKVGSSTNPSSDTYQGTKPFSESETLAVSNFILSVENRYAAIDFHLILRNWGWSSKDSKNEKILNILGEGMKNSIKRKSGQGYTSQKSADLYPAGGSSDDWFGSKAGMIGFTMELRDKGWFGYGFLLPKEQIIPTGEEVFEAVKYFLKFINDNHIPKNE
ncbi:hypothetical protein HK099_004758 [Clydaea vesicula]|uniref:Peptidase M14 domain-containing protein n=1 Tax=Clydaea vesicula TaxID=447962 RepID=A0AAD5TZU6_9FUNG|nr:hypothetical protein HK099_004758 [Clydaea vesicula]